MAACAQCGEQNQPSARFCAACGSPIAAATSAPLSARKTVTVLFSDVVDSTPLGEQLDPESLRRVMARWFAEMQDVLERHGGTVEKFIGDAVMAVFGVPQLHEDDALRAVRAAMDMRAGLARLNRELARDFGVELHARIGINTGEVVAGDGRGGQALVTGDAVNVAKRLEEAARSGETLLGATTQRLVANAAVLEAHEPLIAKGKADPVEAWTLLAVIEGAPGYARRLDAPLVGRREELSALSRTFAAATRDGECRLLTVIGPAGIGKSRLAAELARSLDDEALIVSGRCLPYGDGITFWPLALIVQSLSTELETVLAGVEDAELIADRVRGAIGQTDAAAASGETFWAVRRLFETLAREQPLVVVVEDIHWAQPTFLDLLEYLAGWSREAPILLLCLSRPELLDERPGWLVVPNSAALTLGPLTASESGALLDELGREWPLDVDVRARVADAAEGNPLYVEQLVAMLAEQGAAAAETIPPSIQALLAARLDRLEPNERSALERAAVAGKQFSRNAVVDLTPEHERPALDACLMTLVRKELIQPVRGGTARDDSFRFRHALIRDAAYSAIPKEQRALLHEQFAARLGRVRPDLDEIIGYHLEQAFRYRAQLGPLDDGARERAARAAEFLSGAARRVHVADARAAAQLLRRAVALPQDGPSRIGVLTELGAALRDSGDLGSAEEVFAEALAAAAGDPVAEARARVEWAFARLHTWRGGLDEVTQLADEALVVLEAAGDGAGSARALMLRAQVEFIRCRMDGMRRLFEQALVHAERVGTENVQFILNMLVRETARGPTPVPEALARCAEIAHRGSGRFLEANVAAVQGYLEAMQGSFDAARARCVRAYEIVEQLGRPLPLVLARADSGLVELLAGNAAGAAEHFRWGCEILRPLGERGYLPTVAALLAEATFELGELEEATAASVLSEETALEEDILSQVLWRTVRAKVLARRGDANGADALARHAVLLASATDDTNLQADAGAALGDVLAAANAAVEAAAAHRHALTLYQRKGNAASARRLRERAPERIEA